ncbi:MAG: YggS family pyridoxal phosphate-dependent enzyme [Proteobacteria bacterium]|nr:YggS family pyridoxal phosphate-dependent enzyme [Pseudomonadota bacterium]
MTDIVTNLTLLWQRIHAAQTQYHRPLDSIKLLAVSKSHSPDHIAALFAAKQQDFAENYLQEALAKISALALKPLIWHFIGRVQSNKASLIAQHFSWVHTVYRLKEAQALSAHRPSHLGPLNICLQVKLENASNRAGAKLEEIPQLIQSIKALPLLRIRGLMTLPPYTEDFEQQRYYFKLVKTLFDTLNTNNEYDTLSMGMSHDFEAAIAEGATLLRVGTGIFGPRTYPLKKDNK